MGSWAAKQPELRGFSPEPLVSLGSHILADSGRRWQKGREMGEKDVENIVEKKKKEEERNRRETQG